MTICLVISSLRHGGAERVAAMLASAWAERGHDVTVATFDADDQGPRHALHQAVRVRPLGLMAQSAGILDRVRNTLRRRAGLRRLLTGLRPDVAVSFMDSTNILTILAGLGTGIPVVASERVHPALHPVGPALRLLRRLTYPLAACLVVQTRAMAECFPYLKRMRVIANPVAEPLAKAEPQTDAGRNILAAAGRLERQKGFDLLLDVFAKLAPKHPGWDLVIHGQGSQRPDLEDQIRRLGLEERAFLPGHAEDLAGELAKAKLFALSSRYEGFPNALCEAMAAGLPAVAFDCPSGPADIVRHETDGLLVPAGDAEALAQALDRLMADPRAREALGREARTIVQRFSPGAVLDAWEDVLTLAAGKTPAAA